MCLSGLMGVGVPAVTRKGEEYCWLGKGVAAYFLAVLFLSVLRSQRKVKQISFEARTPYYNHILCMFMPLHGSVNKIN